MHAALVAAPQIMQELYKQNKVTAHLELVCFFSKLLYGIIGSILVEKSGEREGGKGKGIG